MPSISKVFGVACLLAGASIGAQAATVTQTTTSTPIVNSNQVVFVQALVVKPPGRVIPRAPRPTPGGAF